MGVTICAIKHFLLKYASRYLNSVRMQKSEVTHNKKVYSNKQRFHKYFGGVIQDRVWKRHKLYHRDG